MSKEERNSYYNLAPDGGRIIPIGSTSLGNIRPTHDCRRSSIVVYGNYLGSNIGYKLDSYSLANIYLTSFFRGQPILVGLLLGDGNIRKPTPNSNPQIQYNQGALR